MRLTKILIPLLALCVQACELEPIHKESPGINEVKMNVRFKINLPENHSTGALWQLDAHFDKNIVEEISAVWHGNEKGIDFNFKPVSIGQTTLNLVLRTYKDTLNVKKYIVKIVEN